MERERHGVPGQLNVYVLDVDSEVTSFGKHNRLVVFRGTGDESDLLYLREDVRGRPMTTETDRRRIARHPHHRLHGRRVRLTHLSSTPYDGRLGPCVEHLYRIGRR